MELPLVSAVTNWAPSAELQRFLATWLILMALSTMAGLALLGWVLWRVRRIQLPANADFLTALRATPLVVVLLLDLLDFGLDFLSVPIAWMLLGRLGLAPLRAVTVIEEIIPGTQMIPTMTAAWLGVRLLARLPAPRGSRVERWRSLDAPRPATEAQALLATQTSPGS